VRISRLVTSVSLSLVLAASLLALREPATAVSAAGHGIASAKYLKDSEENRPAKLTAAGGRWSYNWTYRVPASTPGLDTVPMLRSATSVTDTSINTLIAGRKAGKYRYLLGFNEPDSVNQANMTPTQAANLWPKLMKTGLILGSPVPAVPYNGWIKEFMRIAKARGLRVDFIALHFYADINDTGAVSRIKTYTQQIRNNYGKPIWITELGIIDRRTDTGSASTNWTKAVKFMRSVTSMLDTLPYVQRYAWMGDNVSSRPNLKWSTLYDAYGRLTPMGVAFSQVD